MDKTDMIAPVQNGTADSIQAFSDLYPPQPIIKFKKLRPEAIIPTKGTAEAAGWDLYASEEVDLRRGDRRIISTGVAVAIPKGYVGLLCSRSGMVAKTGVHVANQPGVIDSDYRGELKVILQAPEEETKWCKNEHGVVVCGINRPVNPVTINPGDRIAQLVIVPCPDIKAIEVTDLDETARGEGGFGSTGVK